MRLFVGISIPEEVVARVWARVDRLRPLAALRWSHVADLHVTTKFIGEQPDTRAAEIKRALGSLPRRDPFLVSVRRLGWFPNVDAPRLLWAGADAPMGLAKLAADTEHALAPLGVAIDRRTYSPHVTLARVPTGARLDGLHQAIVALLTTEFGAFTADRFTLYESRPSDSLARYHALATFPFAGSS
jgi:2'-5' RNA ligase